MVGTSLSIFSPSVRGQLLAIKQTARNYDSIQNTLATGKTVNSAIDNAPKFFTAAALTAEANDLIQEANGIITSSRQDIGEVILADDPVIYYRLNETNTNIIENWGTEGVSSAGRYQGSYTLDTGPLHQGDNSASVTLDGTNGRLSVPNSVAFNRDPNGYTQKTVELIFEAEDLTGRQILFEVGGSGNNSGFRIYLDNDDLYFVANDDANFGLVSVQSSVKIEVGVTYHASFVFDTNAGNFTGYLNGEVAGSEEVSGIIRRQGGGGLGRSTNGANFHDGVNLLGGADLTIYFDSDQQSTLKVEGRRFSTTDFGLDDVSLKTKRVQI